MLFWKAWRETRIRFCICVLSVLWVACFLVFLSRKTHAVSSREIELFWWQGYSLTTAIIVTFLSSMLAGAGLNTQTTYGLSRGLHPSMLFTLSLPVRRRDLVLSRSLAGAFLEVVLLFLPALLIPLGSHFFSRVPMSFEAAVAYSALAAAAGMVLYWIAVLLATSVDEQWQIYGGWIIAAVLVWLGYGLRLPGFRQLVDLALSTSLVYGHRVPWTAIASCMVVSVVLLTISIKVAERREY